MTPCLMVKAAAVLLCGSMVWAQEPGTIPKGETLPVSCTAGESFYLTVAAGVETPAGLYYCVATNDWDKARLFERVGTAVTAVGTPGPQGIQGPAGPAGEAGPQGEPGTGGLPSGAIFFLTSGTCPTGTTEASDLNGKTLFGTLAANKDVGEAVGSDAITPAGTFTGTPFSDVINHAHPVNVTDPGHAHVTQRYPTSTGGSSGFTIDTSMSGTLADNTLPTKSGTTGITATSTNPAGGVASITPAGTFAGTPFDNRSAGLKVIFCRVN